MITCGECGNVTAPGAGFPNHIYCKRFLLHIEKRKDASRCRYFIPKPMTNADRIRAMSDEELAEFMNHGACPPGEGVSELCYAVQFTIAQDEDRGSVLDMCNLCWLNWLREQNSNS